MNPEAKPFPIYQLQDAFEAFCNSEPLAKPQHRSLYYFLLGYCRRRGNAPRFNLAYEAGMHGSGVGSWATYDAALKALAEWGFILYTPGANRYKVPVVELTFRNPTDDVLLTYWQSYCLSTANPTDDVLATQLVTLKEELNKAKEEIEKLKKEGSKEVAQPAGPQKKIEDVADIVVGDIALESHPPPLRAPGGAAGKPKLWPDQAAVFSIEGFKKFVTAMGFAHIDRGFYLPDIQRKAALTQKQRDETGWENFVQECLKREVRDQKLVTTATASPANPQQHAVSSRNYQQLGPAARAAHVPDVTSYGSLN